MTARSACLAAAIAAGFSTSLFAAGVARVDFATGNVTAVAPDGRSRALSRGSEINVGETVATQQGRAQLRFADGAYMSLQPQTEFKVEEFKFSGKEDASDNIVMSLLKGGMRTITGLIGRANRNNYKLRTDVATIGIRGTEYSVRYTNSIEVFCADGQILVQNEGGTLQLNGGQGGFVASNQQPPQQTENRPVLPPQTPLERDLVEFAEQGPQDPVNPVQEANPPVPQNATVLTGKQPLNMAFAAYDTCSDGCMNVINRLESTGELDGAGRLVAFDDPQRNTEPPIPGTTTIGSASALDTGNDGIIAWGRWAGGTLAGDGEIGSDSFTANHTNEGWSLHYVVGTPTPATDMSALEGAGVTASYALIGGTRPTSQAQGIGTLTGGQLTARFGLGQVDMVLNVAMPSRDYVVRASGMPISGSGFSGTQLSTAGCEFSCTSSVAGIFAGANAARAGAAYRINDGGTFNSVFGAAAFARQ